MCNAIDDLQCSKRLLTGSVVCLSYDGFQNFTVATVTGKREPDELNKGLFKMKFQEGIEKMEMYTKNVTLTMIESMAFFEVNCFIHY